MYGWLAPMIGFLVNPAGFSGCFQHNGLAQNSPISVKLETHIVEEPASVFTFDGVGETKHLPISFQLQPQFSGQILGESSTDLVQNFLV